MFSNSSGHPAHSLSVYLHFSVLHELHGMPFLYTFGKFMQYSCLSQWASSCIHTSTSTSEHASTYAGTQCKSCPQLTWIVWKNDKWKMPQHWPSWSNTRFSFHYMLQSACSAYITRIAKVLYCQLMCLAKINSTHTHCQRQQPTQKNIVACSVSTCFSAYHLLGSEITYTILKTINEKSASEANGKNAFKLYGINVPH